MPASCSPAAFPTAVSPLRLRTLPSQNELTGDHSCIMLRQLTAPDDEAPAPWLDAFCDGPRMPPFSPSSLVTLFHDNMHESHQLVTVAACLSRGSMFRGVEAGPSFNSSGDGAMSRPAVPLTRSTFPRLLPLSPSCAQISRRA